MKYMITNLKCVLGLFQTSNFACIEFNSHLDSTTLTGKFANCAPEISKIYYEIYREHQNWASEISVAQYKLSRLVDHNHSAACRTKTQWFSAFNACLRNMASWQKHVNEEVANLLKKITINQ